MTELTRNDWDNLRWIAHNGALSVRAYDVAPLVALGYVTVEPMLYSDMLWARITPAATRRTLTTCGRSASGASVAKRQLISNRSEQCTHTA